MENSLSEKKFIEAYDAYCEDIFRFCFFKTKDRELAKDLMQESFLKTWGYMKDGRPIENIRAFLYRIAGNLVIDWYRKRQHESLDNLREEGFDPADKTMRTDQAAEISMALKVLDRLPPQDREIIVWRYVDDFSLDEIADMLKKKKGTVSVAVHRAYDRLKRLLRDREDLNDK